MAGQKGSNSKRSGKHGAASKKERQVAVQASATGDFVHKILEDPTLDLRRSKPGSTKLQAWPSKFERLLSTFQAALPLDAAAILTFASLPEEAKKLLLAAAESGDVSRTEVVEEGEFTVIRRRVEPAVDENTEPAGDAVLPKAAEPATVAEPTSEEPAAEEPAAEEPAAEEPAAEGPAAEEPAAEEPAAEEPAAEEPAAEEPATGSIEPLPVSRETETALEAVVANLPSDAPSRSDESLNATDRGEADLGISGTASEFADDEYSTTVDESIPPAPTSPRAIALAAEQAIAAEKIAVSAGESEVAPAGAATEEGSPTATSAAEEAAPAATANAAEETAPATVESGTGAGENGSATAPSSAASSVVGITSSVAPVKSSLKTTADRLHKNSSATVTALQGALADAAGALKRRVRWLDGVGASLTQFAPARDDGAPGTGQSEAGSLSWGQRNARGLFAGACVAILAASAFALSGPSRKRRA